MSYKEHYGSWTVIPQPRKESQRLLLLPQLFVHPFESESTDCHRVAEPYGNHSFRFLSVYKSSHCEVIPFAYTSAQCQQWTAKHCVLLWKPLLLRHLQARRSKSIDISVLAIFRQLHVISLWKDGRRTEKQIVVCLEILLSVIRHKI